MTAILIGLAAGLGWAAHRIAAGLIDGPAPPPPLAAMIGTAMLMAAAALGLAAPAGPPPAGAILGWGLLALAAVDVTELRLPDALTLPLSVAGLGIAAAGLGGSGLTPTFSPDALVDHLVGAAAGYGAFAALAVAYRRLRGRDGLGLGDAKLAACTGAWLGWRALPLVVLLACAFAFLWVAARLAIKGRRGLDAPLAFGAPLALATWIVWLADLA